MTGSKADVVVARGRAGRRTWRAKCSPGRARAHEPDAPEDESPPPQDFSRLLARLAPGEDPAHVEAWLRDAHGSLETIDAVFFAREVKRAVERIRARDSVASDELARSYGLLPRTAARDTITGTRRDAPSAIAS